jgi:hypothetical protein
MLVAHPGGIGCRGEVHIICGLEAGYSGEAAAAIYPDYKIDV